MADAALEAMVQWYSGTLAPARQGFLNNVAGGRHRLRGEAIIESNLTIYHQLRVPSFEQLDLSRRPLFPASQALACCAIHEWITVLT